MGQTGLKIRAGDGLEEKGFPEMLSTPLFYEALPGDRLTLLDKAYKFNVATYQPEIEPRWIYTYAYAPDQSWTVYRNDLSGDTYRQDDYIFRERLYFRVCLRKADGNNFNEYDDVNNILAFEAAPREDKPLKPWLVGEALRVSQKINSLKTPGDLVFAMLTDTHYVVNGTWEDTAAGLAAVHKAAGFDGIIHLGDFTDGMTSGRVTRHYAGKILEDLKSLNIPVWAALGNHDSNYFKKNPDRFSVAEQIDIYLDGDSPRYFIDFEKQGLRLIILDSFDADEELRYGYSRACVGWLAHTLDGMPEGWKALVCSHLPPVTRLQYWAKEIRGDRELMETLNARADRVLAFINGHNHADRIDNEAFPIISLANAKCEAFTEYKPPGFITPERKPDTVFQECWDVMLINPESKKARFIRFGSGRDKIIANGKADWV
jgi:predicted phosphodiesterase